MAQAALFVGWGPVVSGREQQSLTVFNEVIEFYMRMQQQGEIESFEPVLLDPHGGDLNGFILIRGDLDKLSRLRYSETFLRLNARGSLVVNNLGVVGAFVGEGLNQQFASYQQNVADLT